MKTLKNLIDLNDEQRELADRFCDAAQALARIANGISGRVMPAPTAYDLLGNLKAALGYLAEVAVFVPDGVRNSLTDERIDVYDQDLWTGERRDASRQVTIAEQHLKELLIHLEAAQEAAEAAQVALSSQGYRDHHEMSRR